MRTKFSKIVSVAIATSLMVSLLGHAAYAEQITPGDQKRAEAVNSGTPFKDIKGHWAEQAILQGYEKGYISTSSTNTFQPNDSVTRADFIEMLVKALELPLDRDWEATYTAIAQNHGLFEKDSFPYRNWDVPLRKHQLAHIAVRALQNGEKIQDDMYDAVRHGFIGGSGDGKLNPIEKTTRAQAAVVIDRVLRVRQGEKLPVDTKALKNAEKDKTAKKDPWGRAIRTTNLPKNHKDFPYILKEWPNEMYNLNHDFNSSFYKVTPVEYLDLRTFDNIPLYNTDHLLSWVDQAETYMNHVLNVDYRKLDDSWMEPIKETVNKNKLDYLDRQLNSTIGDYMTAAKKSKIKVTSGTVKAEPSIVFSDGYSYMRVYFTFTATSFADQSHLFYSPTPKLRQYLNFFKSVKIKKNVEYEVFANLEFSNDGAIGMLDIEKISFRAFILHDAIIREKK